MGAKPEYDKDIVGVLADSIAFGLGTSLNMWHVNFPCNFCYGSSIGAHGEVRQAPKHMGTAPCLLSPDQQAKFSQRATVTNSHQAVS